MNIGWRDAYDELVWQYRKYSDDDTVYKKAVVRNSDNKALAIGLSRKGCDKVAAVFRSLGVPCRVVSASGWAKEKNSFNWNKDGTRVVHKRKPDAALSVTTGGTL